MLVGELEGKVSTDRLKFEAFKEVEKFDFVTVKNPKEGQEWILAQVDEIIKQQDGKMESEAQVIGYRENGMLKQPRHVVDPDAMVYRADEEVIAKTLGLTQEGLYLGRLDTNPDISIYLDPEDLYKHIAVLAKTGAGKSYFTGVMIEELLEADYPVIIIDPHGEYHTLARENQVSDEQSDKYGIDPEGYDIIEYSTNTEVNPSAEELSFSSRNLDAKEIEQVVPTNLTNAQLEVLYNALKDLEKRDSYSLQDVVDRCMEGDSKAKWNLVSMLEVVQDSNLFADDPTDLEQFVEPGQASIVNLKGSDPEMQEMAVYKLAKELFEKRKRGGLEPFVMVMEEAHNFVPERNFGKAVCSDILRTIASEGRKFGLGLGVVSQRPARVDKNVLSQCNTQFILRVTNPNDLNAISRSFEGVTSEVKDFITSLPPGTGLLLGKEYPVMTDVRTRRSSHGGEAKELSEGETSVDRSDQEEIEKDVTGIDDKEPSPEPRPGPEVEKDSDSEVETNRPESGDRDVKSDEDFMRVAPSISFEKFKEKAGTGKVAYYPLHLVDTGKGEAVVDATDGELKGVEPQIGGETGNALEILKRGDRTRGELLEALDISLGKLQRILETLEDKDLIEEREDHYRYSGHPALVTETEKFEPSEVESVIEEDISPGEASRMVEEEIGGEESSVETVYYPYYTAGEQVFDAVRAEEV